ncbi:hypothetical protein ACLB2K_070683 [Fragaria x ananassa]
MEDIVNNKIYRESLKPGDHIYAYRLLHTYSHHGIYIGGDRVIHYNRTREANKWNRAKPCSKCELDRNHLRGVVKSCVDCFLHGHNLRRFQYGVNVVRYLASWHGTCTTGRPDPPEVAIRRASDYFNKKDGHGFGDYDLFENNCEAFAVFCKTEKAVSSQAWAAVLLLKAGVKIGRDRLLHDVKVHHGQEKHDKLKQMIDSALTDISSLRELIANLQKDQAADSGEEVMGSPVHEI